MPSVTWQSNDWEQQSCCRSSTSQVMNEWYRGQWPWVNCKADTDQMAVLAEPKSLKYQDTSPCGPEVSSVHQYQEYREATLSFPIRLTSQKLTIGKYKMMKHFELIFQKQVLKVEKEKIRYHGKNILARFPSLKEKTLGQMVSYLSNMTWQVWLIRLPEWAIMQATVSLHSVLAVSIVFFLFLTSQHSYSSVIIIPLLD